MKPFYAALYLSLLVSVLACNRHNDADRTIRLNGTWKLISGMTITNGVKSTAEYPQGISMIKIINDDHFAFLKHDMNPPADSSDHFDGGGGSYTLTGDQYTERLEYYGDRNWEGRSFSFTVSLHGDTLIQRGVEKVDKAGVNREIIEEYLRMSAPH